MKKKWYLLPEWRQYWKFKWFLCMRLVALFLLTSAIHLSAATFGQSKVSLSMKNVSMETILEELESKTGHTFFYKLEYVTGHKNLSIEVDEKEFTEVLQELLNPLGLTFSVDEKVVLIRQLQQQDEKVKQITINGKVTDVKGSVLPGVTVYLKGAPLGTSTNREGAFRLTIPEQDNPILVFSFIGMKTLEIKYKREEVLNIVLEEDVHAVEEVVVTGYQVIDRRHLTGSAFSVKAEDVLVAGMTSIDQALEGRVPELLFMANSGEVGATPRIRVRGTSTLLGNREPLWVLDGFILHDPVNVSNDELNDPDFINIIGNAIAGINPQDIERIDVLKDAAATALYGTRAANGVIVVTTKKGAIGPARISYNHSSKFTRRPRYSDRNINLMNSQERVKFGKDLSDLHYQFPSNMTMVGYEGAIHRYYTGLTNYDEFLDEVTWYETVNTDWFKILTRDTYSHDHTIGISGGNEQVRYYTSFGYNRENGVSKTTFTERYTMRANIDLALNEHIRMNISLNGNVQKKNHLQSEINAMDYAYNTTRALPCYNEDGTLFYYDESGYGGSNRRNNKFRYNILNEIQNSSSGYEGNTLGASVDLRYKVFKDLELNVAGNYSRSSTIQEEWWGEKSHYVARWKNGEYEEAPKPGDPGHCYLPYGGILKSAETRQEGYTFRAKGDYRKIFGEEDQHMLTAMLLFELNGNSSKSTNDESRGYVKDRGMQFVDNIDLVQYPHYASWINANHHTLKHNITKQVSGLFTLSYSYNNHFTLHFNARSDASNKFGSRSNEKFLPVWSISGMWSFKDNLLKNVDFVNDMRIKSSYGVTGNMLDDQGPNLIIRQGVIEPMYNENISTVARYPNPNLEWEKTRQFNVELNASLLNNRLSVMATLYNKQTIDAFSNVRISSVNGVPNHSYQMNGGDIENVGFSIMLSATPIKNKNFTWRFSTFYSENRNKMKSETVESYKLNDYLNGTALINGQPISTFYSYKYLGLNPNNGTPMFDDYSDRQHLLEYKELDETIFTVMENSGQREPIINGNFSNTFTYKNLSLSVNMSYSIGGKVRLFALYSPIVSGVSAEKNVRKEFVNRWKAPGDERYTDVPVIMSPNDPNYMSYVSHFSQGPTIATNIQNFASSVWDMYDKSNHRVVSASFLKCQSLSLRYTIPTRILQKTPFSNIQASLNTQNPFTWSAKGLKGQDPTQAGFDKPNLSIRPSYTFQINLTF